MIRTTAHVARGVYNVVRHHPSDAILVAEALRTLLWARWLTRRRSFAAYGSLLRPTVLANERRVPEREAARIAWAVAKLAKRAPTLFDCLPQALAVQTMLRRRGAEAKMCFGVKKMDAGHIEAHAWLLWGDKILIGALPDLDRYVRLPAWPEP